MKSFSIYFKPKEPVGRKATINIRNILIPNILKIIFLLLIEYKMNKIIKNINKKFVGFKKGPKNFDK